MSYRCDYCLRRFKGPWQFAKHSRKCGGPPASREKVADV